MRAGSFGAGVVCLLAFLTGGQVETSADAGEITFKKHVLESKFRSEGVAVADFNQDGKLDIAAGDSWFEAPNWNMHPIAAEPQTHDPKKYSRSFNNFAEDLDQDGYPDFIVVEFPGQETVWYQNPGKTDSTWQRHVMVAETNDESPQFNDIDGDRRGELIHGMGEGMAISYPSENPTAPWQTKVISTEGHPRIHRFYHGLGTGDVNGDGRDDVIIPHGWWEQPENWKEGAWTWHAVPFHVPTQEKRSDMHAYDFDGDGDQDVLCSNAHDYGIWWHEQTPDGWIAHEISKTFSQTHSLCLADINQDGVMDFVTGKRHWAHGGRDPGGNDPAVMYWFETNQKDGSVEWTAHLFDHNSGVGTQFEVIDVNGDGLLDVVTSNKKGTFYFEQQAKAPKKKQGRSS
ncbi:Repeat domain in Vibrio, Colwellia, Bradyrhizobium and Shewanella [Planctomycetales bacterium 10988]|nr:Repeat domain in Vibrio, Colwellia, Bradyrhizobium and Shewanella [Planctomycetales bacterium 10988]